MGAKLNEMQEKYYEISLKFAEMEGKRQLILIKELSLHLVTTENRSGISEQLGYQEKHSIDAIIDLPSRHMTCIAIVYILFPYGCVIFVLLEGTKCWIA